MMNTNMIFTEMLLQGETIYVAKEEIVEMIEKEHEVIVEWDEEREQFEIEPIKVNKPVVFLIDEDDEEISVWAEIQETNIRSVMANDIESHIVWEKDYKRGSSAWKKAQQLADQYGVGIETL